MNKRCKFCVDYDGKTARFSDREDAQRFAQAQKYADVYAPDGIIGQWRSGIPTREFAHLTA